MATKSGYDGLVVKACRRALARVAELVGDYGDSVVLVGGNVPPLLYPEDAAGYSGTIDVDLAVDHLRSGGSGPDDLEQVMLAGGFRHGNYPYVYEVDIEVEDKVVTVRVEFISGVEGGTPPKDDYQVFEGVRAVKNRGSEIAFLDNYVVDLVDGSGAGASAPRGLRVAGAASFLAMKGIALEERYEPKDAWDIYFCLRHHPGGLDGLIETLLPFMENEKVREGIDAMARLFSRPGDKGPRYVADFEEIIEAEERELIQRDACERVAYLARGLGLAGE